MSSHFIYEADQATNHRFGFRNLKLSSFSKCSCVYVYVCMRCPIVTMGTRGTCRGQPVTCISWFHPPPSGFREPTRGGGVRLGSKASLAALSCSYFEMRIDTYSTCISVAFQTKLSVLKLERQWLLFSEAGVWLCSPGRSGLSLSCLSLPSAGLVGAHHPSALN